MPRGGVQGAAAVDGRMGAEYKEPQHAPGCPCPRCTGKERPPMGEADKWRVAAESSVPYCAGCGAVLAEEARGLPCDDCTARGVVSPEQGGRPVGKYAAGAEGRAGKVSGPHAANLVAYRTTAENGVTTAVAGVIADGETHAILETPGWVEARALSDPRFFAACKYPASVTDSLPFGRLPLAAVGCQKCRAFVARRGLDLGAAPQAPGGVDDTLARAKAALAAPPFPEAEPDPLERAIAAYRRAGGGLSGRKMAARSLHRSNAYTTEAWAALERSVRAG